MIAVLLATAALLFVHPDSLSSSRLEVSGDQVWLRMRTQVLSLLEVVPELDVDQDGLVDEVELAAVAPAVLHYVGEHYRLSVDTGRDGSGGRPLVPQPVGATLLADDDPGTAGYRLGAVDVELVYQAPGPITDLMIESRLFATTSPGHVDIATIVWPDGASRTFSLSGDENRGRSDPAGRGTVAAFLGLGWHHILSGWDHLAFVAALLLATATLRGLLGVVTAFTLAHSVTLAFSALGLVDLGRHAGLVEALIALSVAYVALDTALHPRVERSRWKEAFAFGLLHGLGFAGFLRESLVHEDAQLVALISFNVGVELGQVAVVLVLVGLLRLWPGPADAVAGHLGVSRGLRRVGSTLVGLAGLVWFVQRL